MGIDVAAALAAGGWLWHRWKRARKRVYDPLIIKEKVSRIAFDGELQLVAVLPGMSDQKKARERARMLLEPVAAAYRHYDHPAGARFRASKVRPIVPDPSTMHPTGPGLFGKRSVLGVREAAALWHPPGAGDETPLVERSGARVLMPLAKGVRGGAPVGQTTAGRPRPIHFPDDLLRHHHLYVARTRMGKSTLMHHIVVHKMMEKAAGRAATPSSSSIPTPTWWAACSGTCRSPSSTGCASSTWPTNGARPASTCWTPASSPTATAPPTRWFASPRVCGTSGGRGCSPSSSRPSRPSTRPTSTPPRPTTSS